MESKYFAYLYSRKTKGSNMKKSLILELCRKKVMDDYNLKKEGFGLIELEVVGFKEYDDFFRVIFLIQEDQYVLSKYSKKNGKISNKRLGVLKV